MYLSGLSVCSCVCTSPIFHHSATPRTWLHRVLVCAGALLCLPLVLCLAYCLSSRDRQPQPHPRTQTTHVAEYRDQPRATPKPLPRRKVPQKSSTSSQKGLSNFFENYTHNAGSKVTEMVFLTATISFF